MTDFRDKNVLITGAASGIGRLLAERIAGEGAHLILWDIDGRGLGELRVELERRACRASIYRCDLADRRSIDAAARLVLEECGPVDVLINNAGVVNGESLLELSDDAIQRTFDVNTLALFWVTRAFLPAMVQRNTGHVVTIASAGGLVGTPRLTDYCASKFAAVGFDEALRLELRRQGLRVKTTVVCPFYVRTGMFEGARTRFPRLLPILEPEKVADRIVEAIRRDRRRLYLPRLVYLVAPLRVLPTRWFDAVLAFLGVTASMDEFAGRRPARPGGPGTRVRGAPGDG
jgi:all-trans-retinol dehydrogenase (NAD+)